MNKTQSLGQTLVLSLKPTCEQNNNEEHLEKFTTYNHVKIAKSSSTVADPSHSPIERGQRHGTLGKGNGCKWLRERRKDKERIIIREIEKVLAEVRFLTRFVVLNKGGVHG